MKLLTTNQYPPAGQSVMATIGMFDGVHRGHQLLLQALKDRAAQQGLPWMVITFRSHPRQVLNPELEVQMLMRLDEKLAHLQAFEPDYIVLLDFTPDLAKFTSKQFMQLLHDSYGVTQLMVGYNHHFGHDLQAGFPEYAEYGREIGIQVIKAPEYLGEFAPISSSIIRKLIASGKVDVALRCMGRPYAMAGEVIHGFRNGHKIGFPTANIAPNPAKVLPHNGAYAVMVDVRGQQYQGMLNIGRRPTLNNGEQLSIECNIFDFDQDIYGEHITVHFIRFLRLEFKMVNLDGLIQQLCQDRTKARDILDRYQIKGTV